MEVFDPSARVGSREAFGIDDDRGHDAGFVDAALPQRQGKFVITTEWLGQAAQRTHRNTQRVVDIDAEAGHPSTIVQALEAAQRIKDFFSCCRHDVSGRRRSIHAARQDCVAANRERGYNLFEPTVTYQFS